MIQHPAVIALLSSAALIDLMAVYAAVYGIKILVAWDIASGSEQQLQLERRTYLISTILGYTLAFQVLSLFLLIYTADSLYPLFTGAMCAAGSLSANGYGYPLLLLKIVNALFASIWLIVNHLDSRGYDYPLIRIKYALLLLLALLVTGETVLQFGYFLNLKADLITSCCGSLFSPASRGITGEIASLPATPMMFLFAAAALLLLASFAVAMATGRGWYLFSGASMLFFLTATVALISFICLYFYELPTHHCPFCILQREYGHIGYLLYACLLGGAVAGGGVGVAERFKGYASLRDIIPRLQKRAAIIGMVLNGGFIATVAVRIFTTSFRL
jgi:hypothetical protein